MASTYSPLLRLELIGTGEQSGTWGITTNTNLGTLLEQSIAGMATISVTAGNVTLTEVNGSSDQSRCAILRITGTPGTPRNVIAPALTHIYNVFNDSDSDVTVKTSTSTGVVVPSGTNRVVAYDGTDFIPLSLATADNGTVQIAGDIIFTGTTGATIFGDFSGTGATDRLIFKTTTTNGATGLRVLPNGTGTNSNMAYGSNGADPDNSPFCSSGIDSTIPAAFVRSFALGTGTTPPLVFSCATGSTFTERMRINTTGEVLIGGSTDQGAYNLQVNGTGVWGAGAYVNGSDARIKENVADIDSCLDVVKSLRPVTYQYKESYSKDRSVQPGFIAQELQTVMAGKNYLDGVVQQGKRQLNVAYQNIIPILTKAIQEQQEQIEQLKAEVAALKGA